MSRIFVAFAMAVSLLYPVLLISQPYESYYGGVVSACKAGLDCSKFPAVASNRMLYYGSTTRIIALSVESGKPLWTYSLPKGWVASNLVTLGARLFFAGNAVGPCAPFYAVDLKTRRVVWSKGYGSCLIWSDGKRLYLQGGNGDGDGVMAVDPATGKVLWHAEGEKPQFVHTLVIRDGRIYTDDRVLDANTGQTLLWWPKESSISGITATGPVVVIAGYIGGHNGVVSAYNAITLKREWSSVALAGKAIAATVSLGRLVYAVAYTGSATSARDGVLQALDANTGRPKWSYRIHSCCQNLYASPMSVGNGTVFLVKPADAQSGSRLVALDSTTGKVLWSYQSAMALQGPAFPLGSSVYVTDSRDFVIALDAATGKVEWTYQP